MNSLLHIGGKWGLPWHQRKKRIAESPSAELGYRHISCESSPSMQVVPDVGEAEMPVIADDAWTPAPNHNGRTRMRYIAPSRCVVHKTRYFTT
jgi:hypothetical protein